MSPTQNIYLIGYMGCGKTVVGKRLSEVLDKSFCDTDQLICRRTGLSVNEIFNQCGEGEFRRLESAVIAECAQNENQVISTGGGAVSVGQNLEIMLRTGLVIYLQLPADELVKRLLGEQEKRPLIRDKNPEELKTFVKKHLQQRAPDYEKAHLIFDATQSVDVLLKEINNYSM